MTTLFQMSKKSSKSVLKSMLFLACHKVKYIKMENKKGSFRVRKIN